MLKDREREQAAVESERAGTGPVSSFYYAPYTSRRVHTQPSAVTSPPAKRAAPIVDLTSPAPFEESKFAEEWSEYRKNRLRRTNVSPTIVHSSVSPTASHSDEADISPCPGLASSTQSVAAGMKSSYSANSKRARITGKSSTGSSWSMKASNVTTTMRSVGSSSAPSPALSAETKTSAHSSPAVVSSSKVASSSKPVSSVSAASTSTAASSSTAESGRRDIQDYVNATNYAPIELPEALFFYMRTHNFSDRAQHIISVLLHLSDDVDEFIATGSVCGLEDNESEFMWFLYLN